MGVHKAKRPYTCYRCKDTIEAGETYYRIGDCYCYHMMCRSFSGHKESMMTPALRTFIDKVSSGPKFTDEFGLNSSSVFDAFKKCVMMGIEVHKKKVVRSGKSGATSLFYLNEHRFEAFDRVRGLLGTRSGVLWAEYATAMLEPNDFKTRSSGMHTIFCKCGIPLSKCKKCKKGGGK